MPSRSQLGVVLVFAGVGCTRPAEAPAPRPVQVERAQPAGFRRGAPPRPFATGVPSVHDQEGAPPPPAASTVSEPAPMLPAPAPTARDLAADLRAALPDPTSCLDLATASSLGPRLELAVEATALPSGRLLGVRVTGPLGEAQLACVTRRFAAARLRPVEGAPLEVATSTSYELHTRTRPTTTVVRPAPTALPPGARPPGATLPALGGPPPPGAVPPGLTLPARGAP